MIDSYKVSNSNKRKFFNKARSKDSYQAKDSNKTRQITLTKLELETLTTNRPTDRGTLTKLEKRH